VNRAYSILTIKRASDDAREITGTASTPTTDTAGDVVEPFGAEFKLPIPLLWQHDSSAPIGHVTHANVTAAGIDFRAKIAKVDKPGKLKDRLDEVWDSITAQLVRGLSIGFQPLDWKGMSNGGMRFMKWAWRELSVVTLPCNTECTIATIKAADQLALRRQPVKVVKLARPVSTAVDLALDSKEATPKGLRTTDAMLARSIGAMAKTTDDCLAQLDERVTRLESGQRKSVIDMDPDEFLAHMAAQRKRLGSSS
jgi:HK97 family phage prohead protease